MRPWKAKTTAMPMMLVAMTWRQSRKKKMLATYSPADLYGDWCSYGWACGAYTIPDGSTEIPAAATDGAALMTMEMIPFRGLTPRRGLQLNAVIAKPMMVKDQKVHGRRDRQCPLLGGGHCMHGGEQSLPVAKRYQFSTCPLIRAWW